MRQKNINTVRIEGYIYESEIEKKVTGETSKNPGTEYISGKLDIAVDEDGIIVVPVHFTYVTAVYASGKTNNTFTALSKILANPTATWIEGGKENAMKVRIDASIALNDFIAQDGQRVSQRRNEGSFVTIVDKLADPAERNSFKTDMVINSIKHIDANAERNIEEHTLIHGCIFNFRNEILPVDFMVKNEKGMEYFENLGVTAAAPLFTQVWGKLDCQVKKVPRVQESAFGDPEVTYFDRKIRDYVVTGTAKVPYELDKAENMSEEEIKKGLTVEELQAAIQNREVYWAEVEKRNAEYLASKQSASAFPTAPAGAAKPAAEDYNF